MRDSLERLNKIVSFNVANAKLPGHVWKYFDEKLSNWKHPTGMRLLEFIHAKPIVIP